MTERSCGGPEKCEVCRVAGGHGLAAIVGKWPGDETDEQIAEALTDRRQAAYQEAIARAERAERQADSFKTEIEVVRAALEQCREALQAWEHWYSDDSTESKRDTAQANGLAALARADEVLSGETFPGRVDEGAELRHGEPALCMHDDPSWCTDECAAKRAAARAYWRGGK